MHSVVFLERNVAIVNISPQHFFKDCLATYKQIIFQLIHVAIKFQIKGVVHIKCIGYTAEDTSNQLFFIFVSC